MDRVNRSLTGGSADTTKTLLLDLYDTFAIAADLDPDDYLDVVLRLRWTDGNPVAHPTSSVRD